MEIFNVWMIANVVGVVAALVAFASMSERVRDTINNTTFAGTSGAAMGLATVTMVAGMYA
jgi:uncharacterized membrane protein